MATLHSVVTNGQTTRFTYDGFGRLIRVEGPQETTELLWARGHVLAEVDASTDTVKAVYSHCRAWTAPTASSRDGTTHVFSSSIGAWASSPPCVAATPE